MSMWVKRNDKGRLDAASGIPVPGWQEMPDNAPELVAFITNKPWPPVHRGYDGLIERRARAAERKGDKLGAIILRTGG